MNYTIDKIYAYYGQYDTNVIVYFDNKLDNCNVYEKSYWGFFLFSKSERIDLQQRLENNLLQDEHGKVKFQILFPEKLEKEKVDELKYQGINTECISYIFNLNTSETNEFSQKEKRILPEPSFTIEYNDSTPELTELGFSNHRIKKGQQLLPYERDRYAALIEVFYPNSININEAFKKEYIIDSRTGKVKIEIEFYKFLIKARYNKRTSDEISEEEKTIVNKYLENLKLIIQQELLDAGLRKTDIYSKYGWLFVFLMKVAIDFRPQILLFNTPMIFLDFESLLHIFLRHVDFLQVGNNYVGRSTFQYELSNIEELVSDIINQISGEIEEFYKSNQGIQYRTRKYFRGDYYQITISPNGRLESIHPLKDNQP